MTDDTLECSDELILVEQQQYIVHVSNVGSRGNDGQPGPQGPAGSGTQPPSRNIVPVNSQQIIDTLDINVYRSCKWLLAVSDLIEGKNSMREMMSIHSNGSIWHCVYGILGDPISVQFDAQLIGQNMTIICTNGASNNLQVDAIRIAAMPITI